MADYYPLIARAVAGLEKNTGEARRALYERARTALVAQLRGINPPLQEAEITRERLALEEAIRKVEAEAARRSRIDTDAPQPPPAVAARAAPRRPSAPRFPNAAPGVRRRALRCRQRRRRVRRTAASGPKTAGRGRTSAGRRADAGHAAQACAAQVCATEAPRRPVLRSSRPPGAPRPSPFDAAPAARSAARCAAPAARSVRRPRRRARFRPPMEPSIAQEDFNREPRGPAGRDETLVQPMDPFRESPRGRAAARVRTRRSRRSAASRARWAA